MSARNTPLQGGPSSYRSRDLSFSPGGEWVQALYGVRPPEPTAEGTLHPDRRNRRMFSGAGSFDGEAPVHGRGSGMGRSPTLDLPMPPDLSSLPHPLTGVSPPPWDAPPVGIRARFATA